MKAITIYPRVREYQVDGVELPHTFTTPQQLLADFRHDVAHWMEKQP